MHQKSSKSDTVNRSVISVHTKPEISERLETLASLTQRSKSFLANEAIERYLKEEEAFIASIQEGLKAVEAGNVKTSKQARAQVKRSITQKRSKLS